MNDTKEHILNVSLRLFLQKTQELYNRLKKQSEEEVIAEVANNSLSDRFFDVSTSDYRKNTQQYQNPI